ncbi:MAG: tetratricopeptide repeat protein [Candidatus Obscuribacterales bacterium]|nr:tetratricopeptide repeat protein [Candidatus Obscuribacterales bacterium]
MIRAASLSLVLTALIGLPGYCDAQPGMAGTVSYHVANPDGQNALDIGDYARAESIYSAALGSAAKNSDDDMALHIGLGEALLWQGKNDKAAKEFAKAQSISKSVQNPRLQSQLLDDLSWLSQAKGNLSDAEQYCKDALNIRAEQKDDDDSDLIASMTHLAYLVDQNGRLEEAANLYKQALLKIGQDAKRRDLNVADTVEQLASIYWRQGKQQEAAGLFQEALQVKANFRGPASPYAPHPYWQDVIYSFYNGAPNCMRRNNQGQDQLITSADGLTVAASILPPSPDVPKAVRVELFIKNDSGHPVQFLPRPPIFMTMSPKMLYANMVDPSKMADTIEKKGDRQAAWVKFWGQNATQSVTTTVMGNGGWYPPVWGYGGSMPIINNYGNMSTITTQVPDYAAQQRALQKAADITSKARQNADAIRNHMLGSTTVAPGHTLGGYLYFDINQTQNIDLQIPVGNGTFDFQFPPR